MARFTAISTVCVVVAATASGAIDRGCNFLTDPSVSCALPFPDDFFQAQSWDAAAAPALTFTNASLPMDSSGNPIDPVAGGYNSLKGFPALGPILAYAPGVSLELSSLPRLWDIGASVGPAATSVLLRVSTMTPVAHWCELDHSSDDAGTGLYERALMLWPALRLEDGERYIVAFRNLTDADGVPVAPSDGFAALKYGLPTDDAALEASRPRFAAIFAALASAGWAQGDLTLAWSFTTAPTSDVTDWFLSMRDDAFSRIAAAGGVKFSISSVENAPQANTSRRVHGRFTVPCYLNFDAVPSLDSKLVRGADGLPVFQSNVDFDFEVVIPNSVAAAGKPAKVLQYGHGLFGDHGEVEEGYLAGMAEAHGYVLAATDWIGLSEYDEATVIVMMAGGDGGFADFRIVPDRLHQGMLNALVLMRLVTSARFAADSAVTYGGKQVISTKPGDAFYTGNSQGGIMGGVYMAATTDVTRGVLGVGGGPYALLLPRSSDFSELFDILKIRYPRSLDRMLILALMQTLWARMDPAGWASYISSGSLPGTPVHRVIHHYGLNDHQVTWLGAHAIAHSTGAAVFASNVAVGNQSIAYMRTVPDNTVLTTGNGLMGFDFGFPTPPFINVPPTVGDDAHECPRRSPAGNAQLAHFFATGEIINTCGGACVLNGCPSGGR